MRSRAADAAEIAVTELQREPRGKLRVTTTVPLGQTFLAPIVFEFLEAYPTVEVMLHLSDRSVDLVAERFDIAIRAGALPDSSLVARLVTPRRKNLCCASCATMPELPAP